jgi:hypothetical protein
MSEGAKPVHTRLYEGWMAIAARFGFVQTLVVLGIFYSLIIGPISTGIQLFRGDLLDKRQRRESGSESAWREADSTKPDLERARQQF